MIQNPILPGFNPDPCICRRNDNYYLATSTFEWFPGVAIYLSKDLKNWKLHTHALTDERILDLRRLGPSKGVWAPCLTWCMQDGLFYLVYSIMHSTSAQFFDIDNYVITAPEIEGPWSEPVYLNSSGFDPSMFHDEDGRKWVTNLEWESRQGYEQPGIIVIQEYSTQEKRLIGTPIRIWRGGTDRGCVEGSHIYKRGEYYYLMCAEGGTGYGHCVTMGRSKTILGEYEPDPMNPILTSTAHDFYSRHDSWHLKPYLYNPNSELQKSGHASWIETQNGENYLVHHSSRPYKPELRCTLGRETCIQKMYWTEDGWLRLEGEGNLAQIQVPEANLKEHIWEKEEERDNFDQGWNINYYTPRISRKGWAEVIEERQCLRLRGQESLNSLNRVSFVGRKMTAFNLQVSTCIDFTPKYFQQSSGLAVYYDNCNYLYFRIYHSESLGGKALGITKVDQGRKDENKSHRILLQEDRKIYLKITIRSGWIRGYFSYDDVKWERIGDAFDNSLYSDDYCDGFTGAFIGMCCIDSQNRTQYADFDYFDYKTN
ncbi:MAG: glycoside hydrolase family 43 protein [Niameybacter sp.]